MQATVVLLIALGGLGCQNPASDQPPALPDVRQSASQPLGDVSSTAPAFAPSPYPAYIGVPSGDSDATDDPSFRRCLRNTLYSFVLGRDPDVRTAHEIEADYHAGYYGR